MDLHLVQLTGAGCDGNPATFNKLASTTNGPVKVFNRPAGTYYVIADGFNGAVGSTNLTINISGPTVLLSTAAEAVADDPIAQSRLP
jgi:hypothetical protein